MREHAPNPRGEDREMFERKESETKLLSRVCVTIAAAFLFGAVNLVMAAAHFGLLSPTDFPVTTWTGTAVEDFLHGSTGRPQIAFLGSSLMVTPIISVDADYKQQNIDAPYHHRSLFFEDTYKKLTGRKLSTFNFAIPGEMPSDAFLITKFMLKDDKRPDVIVYGVGPRDFLDNLLPSASATDPYAHLSKFGDLSDHTHLMISDWQERLNYDLGRVCYSYAHKSDLSAQCNKILAQALIPHLPPETAQEEYEYKQMVIPDYQKFAVVPSQCIITPTKPNADTALKDNLAEYRNRYRELKWDTFLTQLQFLGETLDTAKERKIHAVLVAMPITKGNRGLISDEVWHLYKQNLRVMAKLKGADFIDMPKVTAFNDSDFADTVHLNAHGGTIFLSALAGKLAANQQVADATAPKRFYEQLYAPMDKTVAALKRDAL